MSSYRVFGLLLLAPFFPFMSLAQQADSASAGIVARQTAGACSERYRSRRADHGQR
jgi:hypothetical protein